MSDMDWQQKASALNALDEIQICMRGPGNWYVRQRAEIGGDGFLRGAHGNGETPQAAIEDHWRNLTELPPDRHVVVGNRRVRWNGFMWTDIPRAAIAAATERTP